MRQCKPTARNWFTEKQKCEHCARHRLPCGPSYTIHEDPLITLLGADAASPEQGNAFSGSNSQDSVSQTTDKASEGSSASMVAVSMSANGDEDVKAVTFIEGLRDKASTKLELITHSDSLSSCVDLF